MGWRFFGYACVYGSPDTGGDVFTHHCFAEFLQSASPQAVPMLNAHMPLVIGRWLRMVETGYGLLVWGELFDDHPPAPSEGDLLGREPLGLSVGSANEYSLVRNAWGGKTYRKSTLAEISIVARPEHPGARILGKWTDL